MYAGKLRMKFGGKCVNNNTYKYVRWAKAITITNIAAAAAKTNDSFALLLAN